MPKCGLCGGEAPRLASITEDGRCDLCGKKAKLDVESDQNQSKESGQACKERSGCCS